MVAPANKAGWTVDSLLELMNERDRRYEEARQSAQKALDHSEKEIEKWKENANEWRSAMDDRERNFLPRNIGYAIGVLTLVALIFQLLTRLKVL